MVLLHGKAVEKLLSLHGQGIENNEQVLPVKRLDTHFFGIERFQFHL